MMTVSLFAIAVVAMSTITMSWSLCSAFAFTVVRRSRRRLAEVEF